MGKNCLQFGSPLTTTSTIKARTLRAYGSSFNDIDLIHANDCADSNSDTGIVRADHGAV